MTLWRQKKKKQKLFFLLFKCQTTFFSTGWNWKKKLNFTMQDSQMQSISTKLFFINVPFILEHK